MRFVVAASRREKTFGVLCQEFEVSRPTGYLWLRRYQEQGLAGIAERSRRPHVSPRRTGGEWEQQGRGTAGNAIRTGERASCRCYSGKQE